MTDIVEVIKRQDIVLYVDEFGYDCELWNALVECKHETECAPGGGIICTKCKGWFCY